MQRKFQHTFTKSKMNKDLDARLLGADEYRDGQNIAVSRAEADDVGALENILGNALFNQLTSDISDNTNYLLQFIGWHINEKTNKVYIFATDFQDSSSDQISLFASPNSSHKIISADLTAGTVATIVSGRFLNFSYNSPILDTTMIETQLFWTDNRNQPRVINVETAESDNNYYFHEDHISLAKYYPHKPIQLFEEYSQAAGLIDKDTPRIGGYVNFSGIYDYFLFAQDDMSTAMLNALKDNIGLQGYVKDDNDNITEFKVAYVQELTSFPSDPFTNGNALAVFVDRDLSTLLSAERFDPDGMALNYTVYFVDQTSKDVSSPWLREDQIKLTIESVGATVGYTAGASGNYDYAQALYKFGTRSPYNYIFNSDGTTWSPFQIPDHFPKNSGNPAIGFPRVIHPSLDPNKYYVITAVSDPSIAAKTFSISELSGFVDGTLTAVTASDFLSVDDIVTIQWPNKYYDYNFPGDQRFLEDKFVRFAYRFRYDDGEYSVISPFTQEVFIPKQKGYFLKQIGKQKSTGSEENNYVPQEQIAGQNTIVDFMENEVTEVKLRIPCEYAINTLANNLKVKEIDILYKESTSLTIKVAESIDIDDTSITTNTTNFLEYVYQSKQPIKTLRESELTRVYDNVPVRAKTLSSSGNRILLGNFYDRHTSPGSLAYYVSAGRKLTPGSTSQDPDNDISGQLPGKFSNVAYPNHTLKQGRTYQVGLILQDRYGRSSDVILSKFSDTNFTLETGYFANDPQTFFGSTLYHEYSTSVTDPLTANSDIVSSNKVNAGIVNWPGDSLKLLFTEEIPKTISTNAGYPGIFEDPVSSTTISAVSSSFGYIEVPTGGSRDQIQPGDLVRWTASGVDYEYIVQYGFINLAGSGRNRYGIIAEDGSTPTFPSVSQAVDFISANNPVGWFSYKVVVKQLEQDYYNVYLPGILDGTPVIKPFDLTCSFTSGSNIASVDAVTGIEYLTFPLLEGMKVVTPGGNTYYINNVLNYVQFELSANAAATETGVDATFSMPSSNGVLSTTTLLTDNANKIPPALNESTPVQQQFSTSDVRLIPRVGLVNSNTLNGQPYIPNTTTAPIPLFPGLQTLKVQSIGNFESLFKRGSYNGLYQADTDPPTAIIQNTFDIGADPQTVKPSTEAETIAGIYETTPTISNLEIFYETSTSGTVKELNQLVRDNLTVPSSLVTYPGSGTGTAVISSVSFLESVDYAATTTLAKIQIIDQNGTIVTYTDVDELNLSTAVYQNGTAITDAPFTFEQSADSGEQANHVYLLKTTATNPMYSSGTAGLDNVSFNVNFNYQQFGILPVPYSLSLNTFVQNVAPVFNTSRVDDAGDVYYVDNFVGEDPPATDSLGNPKTWDNDDGTNSTKTRATNGSNADNVSKAAALRYSLFVDTGTGFEEASGVTNLNISIIEYQDYVLLSIGGVGEKWLDQTIPVEIRASDGQLTTVISQFSINVKSE